MDTKDRSLKVLKYVLGVDINELNDNTTFQELGVDSLDVTELVMEVETEFDITITDNEFQQIETVGDFLRLIEQKGV